MSRIQIPLEALTSRLNLDGLRSGSLSGRFSNLRPIGEFFDFKRLSKPANFTDMQSRVNYNLSYYSSNYAVLFAMLSIYSLLTNWLLLFDIIFVVAGMWIIGRLDGRDLEIGTFRATTSQLYTGLVIIAVPLGLIASPFSTLLWLIGFFRGGGLDGRPRAPKFAPPWGRPSRRGRRKTDGDAASYGSLWAGDPRVEEVETDQEDSDTQGVGLAARRPNRVVSDSLRFTGIDLGDSNKSLTRHRYRYQDSEDDDDDETSGSGTADSDDDDDDDEEEEEDGDRSGGSGQLALRDKEQALIESALKRIKRAQAKGKVDVKLNKDELAALERQRRRMEQQEQERRRNSGGGSDRKKKRSQKDERIAIPLSQLESMSSRGKRSSQQQPRQEQSQMHMAPDSREGSPAQQVYPPMGYFPPPSTGYGRPRAGTHSQRSSNRGHDESPPVSYQYAQRPSSSSQRHVSDPNAGVYHHEEPWMHHHPRTMNPFQYQTAGPPMHYSDIGPVSSKRHMSGPSEMAYVSHRGGGSTIIPARSRHGSRRQSQSRVDVASETSEEQTSSDDLGHGAQIREPPIRGRDRQVVVQATPERQPTPTKKKSSSPTKRKPAPSTSGKKKKK